MKFFTRLFVIFYVMLVMYLSAFFIVMALGKILLSMGIFDYRYILEILVILSTTHEGRMILGIAGVFLMITNFMFYRTFSVNVQREKTIAFDNPSGRVSVSLVALEDLIKRVLGRLSEIKEAKPNIRATKKGLQIKIRLTLVSETNIPELTARVQEIVKRKIQDIIGLDEPVMISIYVGKIVSDPIKDKKSPEETPKANIPFQGYRA